VQLFHCFAVPRSGTSFFAQLLNSHSQILCGHERFGPRTLKREYFSREGFLRDDVKRLDEREMQALLSTKGELIAIGDKFPRGYLHASNLVAQLPDACFFAPLRDTREIGASWNRRAKDPNDSWPEGMVSVFANIEFLIFAFALHTIPESVQIQLLSYDYLVDATTMESCAEHICAALGTEPDAGMRAFLEQTRATERSPSSTAWSEFDERFYNLAPVSALLTAALSWRAVTRSEVVKDFAIFAAGFRQMESQFTDLLREACEAAFAETPATREYFRRMYPIYLEAGRSVRLAKFLKTLGTGAVE
jgi:hypothetical protein